MKKNKLKKMQNEFKIWLKKMDEELTYKNHKDYTVIEKKLIEIAENNGFELVSRLNDAGDEHIFLIFQNIKNLKFISAFANEEGFDNKELDHID